MPVLEVKVVEPAALSPEGAGDYLSLTKRQIYNLIADGLLIAKRSGARTLVDFVSVKNYYEGLPLKTVAASIPNSPQCATSVRRRRSARAHVPSSTGMIRTENEGKQARLGELVLPRMNASN
jgi:hypothetical protein